MIEVRVPATSANVGPGFDCMGLAVNLYAYVRFTLMEQGMEICGCDKRWQNADNLVYRGFCTVYQALHKEVPGVKIAIDAEMIPEARGLGSSAICITAGVFAANAFCGNPFDKQALLELCTMLEGHPDNVAPAIFGGLSISFMDDEKVYTAKYHIAREYRFCAMIPDYPILTKDAREVLPHHVSYGDAVFNIGRCAALAKGLSEGDHTLVKHACDDRLHQPYRKVLFPQYDEIDAYCQMCGVLTWYISGSGSTMMAIGIDEESVKNLSEAVINRYPTWQVKCLRADEAGIVVKEKIHG